MTIQDLGAIGELVGGAAVIATLIYLAVQRKQNTQTIENSRLLALAQTYQMRADALQAMLVQASDSEYIGPIIMRSWTACRLGEPQIEMPKCPGHGR